MRNPWADEFEREIRSMSCRDDRHPECSHISGAAAGLNPRRFRLEAGLMLCKCPCHASCPLTSPRMTVSKAVWNDGCSCPGADPERVRQAEGAAHFQARREAADAARAQAAGRTQQEVRDLYVAELRARGLPVPPEQFLDAEAAAFAGSYLPGVKLLGSILSDLGRVFRHLG